MHPAVGLKANYEGARLSYSSWVVNGCAASGQRTLLVASTPSFIASTVAAPAGPKSCTCVGSVSPASGMAVAAANIYVIDDDASVRRALARLIRAAGMAVRTFDSAEDFLASGAGRPQCLVLDVRMPGMSGLDLQQRLNASDQRIPIVFMSGVHDDRASESSLAAGACAFLHKPFDEHVLLDAISRAVACT